MRIGQPKRVMVVIYNGVVVWLLVFRFGEWCDKWCLVGMECWSGKVGRGS